MERQQLGYCNGAILINAAKVSDIAQIPVIGMVYRRKKPPAYGRSPVPAARSVFYETT